MAAYYCLLLVLIVSNIGTLKLKKKAVPLSCQLKELMSTALMTTHVHLQPKPLHEVRRTLAGLQGDLDTGTAIQILSGGSSAQTYDQYIFFGVTRAHDWGKEKRYKIFSIAISILQQNSGYNLGDGSTCKTVRSTVPSDTSDDSFSRQGVLAFFKERELLRSGTYILNTPAFPSAEFYCASEKHWSLESDNFGTVNKAVVERGPLRNTRKARDIAAAWRGRGRQIASSTL